MRFRWLPVAVLMLACGGEGSSSAGAGGTGSGGSGGVGNSGGNGCGSVDTSCPTDPPHPGAPCSVSSTCSYAVLEYSCSGGVWVDQCNAGGGGSCIPPFTEHCNAPFTGNLSGASVEIGPANLGAFTPLSDGDSTEIIWGGQGAPMIGYRLRVTGDAPACVSATVTPSFAGFTAPADQWNVTLRCGESLTMYTILPLEEAGCPSGVQELAFEVNVAGVGQRTLALKVDSPGCPL